MSILIDATNLDTTKPLKVLHGMNGSPLSFAPGYPDLSNEFNVMGVPSIRLHDLFGIGDLDNNFNPSRATNVNQLLWAVPEAEKERAKIFISELANKRSIFLNCNGVMKDKNISISQENYEPTDYYIKGIINNDSNDNQYLLREVMFRIGRSLDGGAKPPSDKNMYAALVNELINRYNVEYTKLNLKRPVRYWEIWNEPDMPFIWSSQNPNEYYEFYNIVSSNINVNNNISIGGPGPAGGYYPGGDYTDKFIEYCRVNNLRLDFFSWHIYTSANGDPLDIRQAAEHIRKSLDDNGFHDTKSFVTEWGSNPMANANTQAAVQSCKNAAFVAASLTVMASTSIDAAYYYRGDAGTLGIFNAENKYTYPAQAFYLFNQMFETPNIFYENIDNDRNGRYTLAGVNKDKKKIKILVSSYQIDPDFSSENPTKFQSYNQHYIDSGREINSITDTYSIDHWFGGKPPKDMIPQNQDDDNGNSNIPNFPSFDYTPRNYDEHNQPFSFMLEGCKVEIAKAYYIKDGMQLNEACPSEVNIEILNSNNYDLCTLSISELSYDTVLLIDLTYI